MLQSVVDIKMIDLYNSQSQYILSFRGTEGAPAQWCNISQCLEEYRPWAVLLIGDAISGNRAPEIYSHLMRVQVRMY